MQKAYICRGNQYLSYDIPSDKVDHAPRKTRFLEWISKNWDGIDAAGAWDNGKIYFFKGGKYVRFDILKNEIDEREHPIRDNWHGMPSLGRISTPS